MFSASNHNTTISSLSLPDKPRVIVFSDFDETYMAHHMTASRKADLEALENFLQENCEEKGILFGWITGSTMNSVKNKVQERGLTMLPHFIGSSLGTSLNYPAQEDIEQDWIKNITRSGYSIEKIQNIVKMLEKEGIGLSLQDESQLSEFKLSYYYFEESSDKDTNALNRIKNLTSENLINVNISKCNPNAGDPDQAYDIDFTPLCCGKKQIVKYLMSKHNIPRSHAYAFGDSNTDLDMFSELDNGFLVNNATEASKALYKKNTSGEYARGILEVLKKSL